MFEIVTQKVNNNKDYRMPMVGNMLSSRSATTFIKQKIAMDKVFSSPFGSWEKWKRRVQLRQRHNLIHVASTWALQKSPTETSDWFRRQFSGRSRSSQEAYSNSKYGVKTMSNPSGLLQRAKFSRARVKNWHSRGRRYTWKSTHDKFGVWTWPYLLKSRWVKFRLSRRFSLSLSAPKSLIS